MIAQELELVTPNLVLNTILPPNLDSLGIPKTPPVPVKMVNTLGLIPVLIEGFKEQQTTIDSLNQRLSNLESVVKNCCSIQPNTGYRTNLNTPNTNVILKDNLTIILDQSQPNPFKDETDINYTLPLEIKSASIIFYDQTGRVINKVELKDRGQGTIHIYAPNLSSGLYTYSLIVDGSLIETKTMVKTK